MKRYQLERSVLPLAMLLLLCLCICSCKKTSTDTGDIPMPSLIGMTYEEAKEALNDLKLGAKEVLVDSEEPFGIVIGQDISEGTLLMANDTVTLTVSNGSGASAEETTSPDESQSGETAIQEETTSSLLDESGSATVTTAAQGSGDSGSSAATTAATQSTKESTTTKTTKESTKETTAAATTFPLTYKDSSVSITISKETYAGTVVYAAHIILSDYSKLHTAYSQDSPGSREASKAFASRKNAVFVINGDADAWAGWDSQRPTIKDGKVWIDGAASSVGCIYNFKKGILSASPFTDSSKTLSEVNDGTFSTFTFGPVLVSGGSAVATDTSSRAQRTLIGTNGSAGDIWLIAANGRYCDGDVEGGTYGSPGFTMAEAAAYMVSKGCSFAYNLDGGDSTQMIFKGELINDIDWEVPRKDWDYIYIPY